MESKDRLKNSRGHLFESDRIVVYTDGGSRGNPGPSAIGVVVGGKKYAEYIGMATNNHAEYRALIYALKKVKQLLGKKGLKEAKVEVRMDSELVVKQMNGQFKIEEPDLQTLFLEAWNLRVEIGSLEFIHIPRAQNQLADKILNEVLDRNVR